MKKIALNKMPSKGSRLCFMGISSQFPYIVVRTQGKGSKLDLLADAGATPSTHSGTHRTQSEQMPYASEMDSNSTFDDIINVTLAKLI
jgi:hypothetical protein